MPADLEGPFQRVFLGEENEDEPADEPKAEDDIPTIQVKPDDSEKS